MKCKLCGEDFPSKYWFVDRDKNNICIECQKEKTNPEFIRNKSRVSNNYSELKKEDKQLSSDSTKQNGSHIIPKVRSDMSLKQSDRVIIVAIILIIGGACIGLSNNLYKSSEIPKKTRMLRLMKEGQVLLAEGDFQQLAKRYSDPIMSRNHYRWPRTSQEIGMILRPYFIENRAKYSSELSTAWFNLIGINIVLLFIGYMLLKFLVFNKLKVMQDTQHINMTIDTKPVIEKEVSQKYSQENRPIKINSNKSYKRKKHEIIYNIRIKYNTDREIEIVDRLSKLDYDKLIHLKTGINKYSKDIVNIYLELMEQIEN